MGQFVLLSLGFETLTLHLCALIQIFTDLSKMGTGYS